MAERKLSVLRVYRDQDGFPSDSGFEGMECHSVHHSRLVQEIERLTEPEVSRPDVVLLHVPPTPDEIEAMRREALLAVVIDPRERYRNFADSDFTLDEVHRIPMGSQLRYLALLRQHRSGA